MTLKSVFVPEAIDALEGRMLSAGRDGYERVRLAFSVIPPESAEDTAGVSPQDLQRVVFPTSPEQARRLHLFRPLPRFQSHWGLHGTFVAFQASPVAAS